MITSVIGTAVIAFGVVFLFLGGLGIFRLPDVYNRLQAGTKCTTMGAFCTILGVGIVEPDWFFKALVIAVFILLTNPISAHALARASYKIGVGLWEGTVVDKCKELGECEPVDAPETAPGQHPGHSEEK
jgi:multicomponent Na+:H+ antiporter subunit G